MEGAQADVLSAALSKGDMFTDQADQIGRVPDSLNIVLAAAIRQCLPSCLKPRFGADAIVPIRNYPDRAHINHAIEAGVDRPFVSDVRIVRKSLPV